MNNRLRWPVDETADAHFGSEWLTPEEELRHVRNVFDSLTQDALKTWGELWGEFDERIVSGVAVLPEAAKGFKPECGWPEFLEKMWQLRFYLASAKKICEERS